MYRSRFILLAILAMAPLAPTVSRAQAAGPNAAADLQAKMLKLISLAGSDIELPAPIAGALGLGAGQAWPDRQFSVRSSATATIHAMAAGRGGETDIVLSVRGAAAITVFRVDGKGSLVSATNFFLLTKQTAPVSPAEARAFWAANIDALIARN